MDPQQPSYATQPNKFDYRSFAKKIRRSTYFPFVLIGIVVFSLLIFAVSRMSGSTQVAGDSTQEVSLEKAKAEQVVNKTFLFPLNDQNGKEVSKLKYTIERVELRDEIIVKGQRASSVAGRTFLIVNLKITNDFDKPVQINAKDYIRLTRNDSAEKLAADVHNDPVEVQAISTKFTRVGFPIDDDDKNLTLHIGEINGKKETIKLDLK